jgi:3-methyladenine DNA glycosylase Mpg
MRSTVGPINLAKALGIRYRPNRIDRTLDRTDVTQIGPLFICQGQDILDDKVVATKRKNLKVDTEEPRRFYVKGSKFVS